MLRYIPYKAIIGISLGSGQRFYDGSFVRTAGLDAGER